MRMPKNRENKQGEKGISLIFTAMTLVFVVPLVGLAVDGGILYTVKAKLQTAVDAGALAGARTLSRGNDSTTQANNAISVAEEYVLLNFPNGYFNIAAPVFTANQVTADTTSVNHQRTVSVTASVTAPLYFLRYLGNNSTTVSATATAVRRDVNVVFVMDRSGSLTITGSCTPLEADAENFVNHFSDGTDNVGLVTFGTSSQPDFPIANNFQTSSNPQPIDTILNETDCTGGTNTAQGLSQAYQQLTTLNQPSALNVILLFTDGYANTFTATFAHANFQSSSSCSNTTNSKTGVMAATFNTSVSLTNPVGEAGLFYQVASNQPMSSDVTIGPPGNYSGCSYASNSSNVSNDIKSIPTTDYWGNNMNTGFMPVTMNGSYINVDATSVQNAGFNAADSAALTIRQSTALPNIHVYSIGLGNAGGVSDDFLERVANDPRASNYNSTYPTGEYIYAPTTAELSDAFATIASQILHLSK
jgi:hypothetical protein